MALVENVAARSQTRLGKLTPSADQRKFVSGWAVVEGNAPSGWHGVGDMIDGIPVDQHHTKLLKFHEHKVDGKTRDIKYQGMTLREMVTPREDTEEANRYCGWLSEQEVQREEQNVQNQELGQQFSKHVQSGYEQIHTQFEGNPFAQSEPAPGKPRGWPKGKPRGSRKTQETQPV